MTIGDSPRVDNDLQEFFTDMSVQEKPKSKSRITPTERFRQGIKKKIALDQFNSIYSDNTQAQVKYKTPTVFYNK